MSDFTNQSLVNLNDANDLIPNYEYFDCPLCMDTIEPGKGYILRNCLENICEDCLTASIVDSSLIPIPCPLDCGNYLRDREAVAILGMSSFMEKVTDMFHNKSSYWSCPTPECNHLWKIIDRNVSTVVCPICKKTNCLSCKTIHEGKTCNQYRQTDDYRYMQSFLNDNKIKESLKCYHCEKALILDGGCGAIFCDRCGKHTCQFTGLKVGPDGCNCTSTNPCDANCTFGCFPE